MKVEKQLDNKGKHTGKDVYSQQELSREELTSLLKKLKEDRDANRQCISDFRAAGDELDRQIEECKNLLEEV